jgi:hypothetical protein
MPKLNPEEVKARGLPDAKTALRKTLMSDQQERLGSEIDRARDFGQAHIEKKYGMPFHEWVKKRKQKRESEENENVS